jgi:hypothetical protein
MLKGMEKRWNVGRIQRREEYMKQITKFQIHENEARIQRFLRDPENTSRQRAEFSNQNMMEKSELRQALNKMAITKKCKSIGYGDSKSVTSAPTEEAPNQNQGNITPHSNRFPSITEEAPPSKASPPLARDIPFDVIQFTLYEYLKQTDYTGEQPPIHRHLINGAVAGGTDAFVTNLIHLAKTMMMVDSANEANRSIYTTLASLYRSEGVVSLWKAWKVRVLFTTVGGMLFFGTYEGISRLIGAN